MQPRRAPQLRSLAPITAVALAAALACAGAAPAARTTRATSPSPGFRLAALAPRFTAPVWVGGDGTGSATLYVVEQRGVVTSIAGSRRRVFLDARAVTSQNGGEQGLLSLGFAPDFARTGRLYTYGVGTGGNGELRLWTARNGAVVAGSGRLVLEVPLSPPTETNHNGGTVWPLADGTVLLSVGDGGSGGDPLNNAQNLGRLMGKLLRVAPKATGGYTVPRTNPFVGRAGARGEIWALGLRNPWRFSIDAASRSVWIGDVGQGEREEIDSVPLARLRGANFGWRRMEGDRTYSSTTGLAPGTRYVAPRFVYSHSGGRCSVTGGVVYRGPVAALRGWYLYTDFCTSTITARLTSTGRAVTRTAVGGIVHFGVSGPRGDVYVASQTDGRIYRIVAG